jgi:hypothetical protein
MPQWLPSNFVKGCLEAKGNADVQKTSKYDQKDGEQDPQAVGPFLGPHIPCNHSADLGRRQSGFF